ncbi:MAG: type 1 glutamine amidotransferase [Sporolactobacillus sp.]
MIIDVFQHVPFEGPAAIADWASRRGHTITVHRLYAQEALPNPARVQFLVVLGGPMSVNDPEAWLEDERRCIRAVIDRGLPVLGVCLGGQQIARVLGAAVSAGTKEVGWLPIRLVSRRLSFLPEVMTPLHWHGEQFAIPSGAERLFESDGCANQGFIYGERVVAFQFHMEATRESVSRLLEADSGYLDHKTYVQTSEQIAHFSIPDENHRVLFQLLDQLTATRGSSL